MLMGLVAEKAKGHVFKVLFGSASLVAILRCAALLCLKCPRWLTDLGSPRVTAVRRAGHDPFAIPALSWGPPALSLVVLQWQSCSRALPAHPFTLATEHYGEETVCLSLRLHLE